MNENHQTPPKKGIFTFFKKTVDGLKGSIDFVKSIKEIAIVGISISALFMTDVPQEAFKQVKNLSASIIQRENMVKIVQKTKELDIPQEVQAHAVRPEGVRRSPAPKTYRQVSTTNEVLRINLRKDPAPAPPRETFRKVRILENEPLSVHREESIRRNEKLPTAEPFSVRLQRSKDLNKK